MVDPADFHGYAVSYLGGQALFEPLVSWDPVEQDFTPWLAEEYEIAEDRRSMTMRIRDDVDFVDGTHLDAQIVTESIAAFNLAEGGGSSVTFDDFGVEFTVTGEYELEMTTSKAITMQLLYTIQAMPIVSPASLAEPDALTNLAEPPAGTGPYLLDEYVPEVSASYVRNPDYWNPDIYDFDLLEYRMFADPVAALNALTAGQVNAVSLPAALAEEARDAGFSVHSTIGRYNTLIVLDYRGDVVPALGDVRVRRAMNMAFDRAEILEALERGFGIPSSQPFGPAQRFYVEGGDDRYEFNVAEARRLMAEAGYADGFDLVIPAANLDLHPSAYEPIVQQSLADIGIRVEFEQVADLEELIAAWQDAPVILFSPAYITTINAITLEPVLFGHFLDDPTFAQLVADYSSGTIAEGEQAEKEIGEYLLDQAWYVPIVHRSRNIVTTEDVGLELSPNGVRETFPLRAFRATD